MSSTFLFLFLLLSTPSRYCLSSNVLMSSTARSDQPFFFPGSLHRHVQISIGLPTFDLTLASLPPNSLSLPSSPPTVSSACSPCRSSPLEYQLPYP